MSVSRASAAVSRDCLFTGSYVSVLCTMSVYGVCTVIANVLYVFCTMNLFGVYILCTSECVSILYTLY